MRFAEKPAIFSTLTDVGCVVIRKRIFNDTEFSNNVL